MCYNIQQYSMSVYEMSIIYQSLLHADVEEEEIFLYLLGSSGWSKN